jgi:hypothetical protein
MTKVELLASLYENSTRRAHLTEMLEASTGELSLADRTKVSRALAWANEQHSQLSRLLEAQANVGEVGL